MKTCRECKYFVEDSEYKGLGDCSNEKFYRFVVIKGAEEFYLSEDFGCILFESKQ